MSAARDRWTEWDSRAFTRGAVIAAVALLLVGIVTAASDEGGLTWGTRAGRTLPLAPVCAAVGAWLALAPARARGDDLALASIGRSPWEREAAAIGGGASVALAAALALACSSGIDVGGFYPRAEESIHWSRASSSGFVSDDGVWRVGEGGVPSIVTPRRASVGSSEARGGVPRAGRASAALATAILGLALPAIVASLGSRRSVRRSLAAMGAGALATLLAFQAAAAGLAPAVLAPLPPLLLLAWAASRYRSWPWRRARSRR